MKKQLRSFTIGMLIAAILYSGYIGSRYAYNEVIDTINANLPAETYAESIQAEVDTIKENYGITVHINVDPIKYYKFYNSFNHVFELESDEETAVHFLEVFNKSLNKYSDEALKEIPKDIFVVNRLWAQGHELTGQFYVYNNRQIIIYSLSSSDTDSLMQYRVDHEIFHSLTQTVKTKDGWKNIPENFMDEYNSSSASCSEISDYACTDMTEELAENWALGFFFDDSEKYQIVRNYFYETYLTQDYITNEAKY